MAQARTDYTKVAAPQALGGVYVAPHRIDLFKYLMICMIVFTVVSVFHVWSRFKIVDLNLKMSEISRQLNEADQEQKGLTLEAASLKAPARIEAIAKNDLGMALPTEQQIIHVR
ncbi:MAG: cell division protein FtsL [Desulfuromonadaceae bacterium]|jgi:cell division protein FtsL|nr:cell division protein FtsL [Desulfuromonadaceae bacterium]MDD2848421.1 cell division protein FtsL [Desulfuromonadaceae bacterium]MDD4129950.1 cell division protein FtsL [Desulfuromonadaceae bacterium]